MRSWGRKLLFLLVVATTSAVATPPRYAWITDSLFAENDDVVLILREIGDNHGSHYITQTDTFLITMSREDGSIIAVAPVERVVDVDLGETDIDTTTFTPLDDAVSPYAVRAALVAAPLHDPIALSDYRRAAWQDEGLLVFVGDDLTHRIDQDLVRLQIMTSVDKTRSLLPMLDGLPTDNLLYLDTLQLERDCVPDRTYTQWHSSNIFSALVRLDCTNFDTDETMLLWVTVPAA